MPETRDPSNRQGKGTPAPFSKPCGKIWASPCPNTGKRPFPETSPQNQQKEHKPIQENGTRDPKNSPPLKISASPYMKIIGNFERFQYFNFGTYFLENEKLLRKTRFPFLSEKH